MRIRVKRERKRTENYNLLMQLVTAVKFLNI